MDDAVSKAWAAWPDRFYLVDMEGKVAFRTAQAGKCRASDLEDALVEYLEKHPEIKAEEPAPRESGAPKK